MKRDRVAEVQESLARRGIEMSETAIVEAALDIVRNQDLLYRFWNGWWVLMENRR